jgi:hypothetical protein
MIRWLVRHTKIWHRISTATCSVHTVRLTTTTNGYKLRLSITYLLILFTVYLTKPWLSQIISCLMEERLVNCEFKGFERKQTWPKWIIIPQFAWRDWGEPREFSVKSAGRPVGIQTGYPQNTSDNRYRGSERTGTHIHATRQVAAATTFKSAGGALYLWAITTERASCQHFRCL